MFFDALRIDDLWQGHFHSEIVINTQKFILHNFKTKKLFVYLNTQVLYNKPLNLVFFVTNLFVYFTFVFIYK